MKGYISLLLIMILFSNCKPKEGTNRVLMVNNSNQDLVFLFSDSFPDTVNFRFISCSTRDVSRMVQPFESRHISVSGSTDLSWEDYLLSYPDNTAMVFVYNMDSTHALSNGIRDCDSLYQRNDLILKRYDVDINYLRSNDWSLTYP